MICPVPDVEIAGPVTEIKDSREGRGSLWGERIESQAQGKGGLGGQIQEDTELDLHRCPDSGGEEYMRVPPRPTLQ